jgi:hypothetical protein
MDIGRVLNTYVQARVPVLMTGQPGIGKSAGTESMFEDTPCTAAGCDGGPSHLFVLLASVREPTDIAGWPTRTDKGVVVTGPSWVTFINELHEAGHFVGLFIDELRTVSPAKQAPLLRILNERRVGDFDSIPMGVPIVAAANSVEDSAGGWPISGVLANRMGHVPVVPNLDEWVRGMVTGKFKARTDLGDEAVSRLTEERAMVASFVRARPNLLISMPKEEIKQDGPWPSPRTWDLASHLLAVAGTDVDDENLRLDLISSMVGEAAAVEFITWKRNMDLPMPQDVLAGSFDEHEVFDRNRPDRTYAVVANLVGYVVERMTAVTWDDTWRFGGKCATNGFADVFAGFIPSLIEAGNACGEQLSDFNVVGDGAYTKFLPLIERL